MDGQRRSSGPAGRRGGWAVLGGLRRPLAASASAGTDRTRALAVQSTRRARRNSGVGRDVRSGEATFGERELATAATTIAVSPTAPIAATICHRGRVVTGVCRDRGRMCNLPGWPLRLLASGCATSGTPVIGGASDRGGVSNVSIGCVFGAACAARRSFSIVSCTKPSARALGRILREHREQQRVERGRELRPQNARLRRRALEMRRDQLARVRALERDAAEDHLEGDAAERVDVGAVIDGVRGLDCSGEHVHRRADRTPACVFASRRRCASRA